MYFNLAAPTNTLKKFSCDSKEITGQRNGIIESPSYPTYELGVTNCLIRLTPPEKSEIKFYLIDIGLTERFIKKFLNFS